MRKSTKANIDLLYKRIDLLEETSFLQTQLLREHGEIIRTLLKETKELKNEVSFLNELLRIDDEKRQEFIQYSKDFDIKTGRKIV